MRRICLGLLAACALMLASSGSASATPLSYTFDSDNQGWTQTQDQASHELRQRWASSATGGNPGGHLSATDTGPENGCPHATTHANCSPSTARSSRPLGANYNGLASFDLRTSADPSSINSAAEVWLLAAGDFYLDGFLPSPTGTDYNHFSIPLNELANWRMCPYGGAPICPRPDLAQFKALIGASDQIAVMVDIASPDPDGTGETYDLDNVTLTEGAPAPVQRPVRRNARRSEPPRRSARRSGARRSEADQRRIDGAAPPALVDRLADRQVLDGEAGRIEERDLVGRLPARRLPDQDVTELAHVL